MDPGVAVETMLPWLSEAEVALEWRNWQTHETQNLALGNQRGGSTPPSSTKILLQVASDSPAFNGLPRAVLASLRPGDRDEEGQNALLPGLL